MGCNSVGKALNIVETISFVSWDRDWKVFTKYVKLGISKENFENASHILYQNHTITSYILHYYFSTYLNQTKLKFYCTY